MRSTCRAQRLRRVLNAACGSRRRHEQENAQTRLLHYLEQRIIVNFSNVQKLKQEQDQLRKSFEASIEFAQRIQTIIDNCLAGRKQDQNTIKKLKKQLVVLDIPHQQSVELPVTNSCRKDTSISSLHGKVLYPLLGML